jgi:hypothetical protein
MLMKRMMQSIVVAKKLYGIMISSVILRVRLNYALAFTD